MLTKRNPQGGIYGQWIGRGRVWIESINSRDANGTALVRFDPATGMRSRQHKVPLVEIDFGHVGWNGWRELT